MSNAAAAVLRGGLIAQGERARAADERAPGCRNSPNPWSRGSRDMFFGKFQQQENVINFIQQFISCIYLPLSTYLKEVKSSSTEFIKKKKWLHDFAWQTGYGMFTYSKSQTRDVIHYILNQEEHHRHRSFKEEFLKILKEYEMEHNDKYLFEWICEGEKK